MIIKSVSIVASSFASRCLEFGRVFGRAMDMHETVIKTTLKAKLVERVFQGSVKRVVVHFSPEEIEANAQKKAERDICAMVRRARMQREGRAEVEAESAKLALAQSKAAGLNMPLF